MSRAIDVKRVAFIGLGSMGSMAARLAASRGYEVVGGIDPAFADQDLGTVIGVPSVRQYRVSQDLRELSTLRPDLVVIASVSTADAIRPQLSAAIAAGSDVITICEELAYPWALKEASDIDAESRSAGVTVFATGANPGFYTDVIPAVCLSACHNVRSVEVTRVVDLAPFRGTTPRQFGVGLTPEAFQERAAHGALGHIVMSALVRYVARAADIEIVEISETLAASIASKTRVGGSWRIAPGLCAGIDHRAVGHSSDGRRIAMRLLATVAPHADGDHPGTVCVIEGEPALTIRISSNDADREAALVSTARVINSIGVVASAAPGLVTQLDIPVGAPGVPYARPASQERAAPHSSLRTGPG